MSSDTLTPAAPVVRLPDRDLRDRTAQQLVTTPRRARLARLQALDVQRSARVQALVQGRRRGC